MRYFLTAPPAVRVALEDFSRYAVKSFGMLDASALEVLCRARMSADVTDFPGLVELVDAILASPQFAEHYVDQASDFIWQRFCTAFAFAYAARYPSVSMAAEAEDAADQAYVASLHGSPDLMQ